MINVYVSNQENAFELYHNIMAIAKEKLSVSVLWDADLVSGSASLCYQVIHSDLPTVSYDLDKLKYAPITDFKSYLVLFTTVYLVLKSDKLITTDYVIRDEVTELFNAGNKMLGYRPCPVEITIHRIDADNSYKQRYNEYIQVLMNNRDK